MSPRRITAATIKPLTVSIYFNEKYYTLKGTQSAVKDNNLDKDAEVCAVCVVMTE